MAKTPVDQSSVWTELYQNLPIAKAATTSRVIVDNDVLRHVLFSFDEGQELTEHASPKAVIVNVLTGSMLFSVGGVEHTLHAGDVVYLAPGDRHALKMLEPCYMSLTMVDVADKA